MKRWVRWACGNLWGSLLVVVAACDASSNPGKCGGEVGCTCEQDGDCLNGLSCLSQLCVDAGEGLSASAANTSGSGGATSGGGGGGATSTGSGATGGRATNGSAPGGGSTGGSATAGAGGSATGGGSSGGGTGGGSTGGGSSGGGTEASATGGASSGGDSSGGGTMGAGGAPPDASCKHPTPSCGGDVQGVWTVVSSCLEVSGELDMRFTGLDCSSAPVTGSLEVSGTWTANADGSFSDATTTTGESQIALPADCLNISGTTTTCTRVGPGMTILGYSSVSCVDADDGGCTCAALVDQAGGLGFVSRDVTQTGSYTSADDVLTLSYDRDVEYSYCVSGDALTMTPRTVALTGAVTGEVVLQTQ